MTTLEDIKGLLGTYSSEVNNIVARIDGIERELRRDSNEAVAAQHLGRVQSNVSSRSMDDVRQFMKRGISAAMTSTTNADGGYSVPLEIDNLLTSQMLAINPMRKLCRVVKISTPNFKQLLGKRGTGSGWVAETDARPETATPVLDQIVPTIGTCYAYPKITEELLNDSYFDLAGWLRENVSEEFAYQEALAFVSGNGTAKPTGFLSGPTPVTTADASRAFGTLQYTPSGNASSIPNADVLITLVHSLYSPYRQGAVWQMNSNTLAVIRKMKDGQGNYLWQQAISAGMPETILGYPVEVNENMPDVAANAFPISFGNMQRGYLIVDLVDTRVTRDEVTTPGYVKFYFRRRVGGKIADSNAIRLLKVSVS